MDHPNIAKVLDAGATETGRPYFVMELVRGIRITDYCDQNNVSTGERLKLFTQVCQAIQHAHQKGVIHRDIKPSNILVTLHDGVPVPKVIDFGIAKATQGRLTDQTLFTAFEQFIGTPAYMSPEQAEMSGLDIDTRSDIYSLGVLLYELLVGTTPFAAEELLAAGLDQMRRTIREQEPVRPSTRLSTMVEGELTTTAKHRQTDALKLIHLVRGDLDWIVMKCLEKDRTRRYETANGLAADLNRHLKSEPVVASPPSSAYKFQKFVRRNKLMVTSAALIATVLVIGVLTSTLLAIKADREAHLAKSASESARVAAKTLRQNLYVADVGLAFQAWELGNAGRARDLLKQQRPTNDQPDLRSFEWRYLQGLVRTQELFTLQSKSVEIWGSAISPNGRILATGGNDGKAQLWDLRTGQELAYLPADGWGEAYSFAFSPDGQTLVMPNSLSKIIHVWNVQTRDVKRRLQGHTKGPVMSVAFSPDGQSIASVAGWFYATNEPGEILIWDAASMEKRAQLSGHQASVGFVAFSPDSSMLATPMGDGTILVWNVQSGQVVKPLGSHRGLVWSVAFSPPDGKLIASGGSDGTVRLWDLAKGQMTALLGVHAGPVYSVAFSPDGKQLASASLDQTAKVWDVEGGQELITFKGHVGRIWNVSFSLDGHQLVTGSLDGTAKVWPVPLRSESAIFAYHGWGFATVSFSRHGRWLVRNAANEVTVWNAATLAKVATFPASESVCSPDGNLLVCVHESSFDVWDLSDATPKLIHTISAQDKLSWAKCFSPDGRLLAIRSQGNSITFWRTDEWVETSKIQEGILPGHDIAAYAFSSDGKLFATSYDSGEIRLWNTGDWSKGRLLGLSKQDLHGLAFSPDGRWLAIGCQDTTVQLWDIATGEVHPLRGDAGVVFCLAFTHDGKTLAVGSMNGTVKFWNVSTRREVTTLKAHNTILCDLAFSPDDKTLATICQDQTMRLWTAPDFKETDVLQSASASAAQSQKQGIAP
jgi:eukaryotic-like serine/threonine-protein kinase